MKKRFLKRRRNPSDAVMELTDMFRRIGKVNFADSLLYYAQHGDAELQQFIEEYCELALEIINEDEDESEDESGELTDKQAWKELAALTLKVGKEQNWPQKLIEALHEAFMEESRKAA